MIEKSNGSPTYFASDIAYHYNKFALRDFEFVVDIWGADHQGHIPRLKTVVQSLGIDPSRLRFIVTQMVKLKRGSTSVKMSKRSGELITLSEFIKGFKNLAQNIAHFGFSLLILSILFNNILSTEIIANLKIGETLETEKFKI